MARITLVLDESFSAMNDLKEKLSEAIVSLHEDGYHDYAGEIGVIRFAIESAEKRLANLYMIMESKKGAK